MEIITTIGHMEQHIETEEPNYFIRNLRTVREYYGLSGRELSIKAGLKSQKRINDLEEDRMKPNLKEVVSICKTLKVSIDDMMNKKAILNLTFESK